MYPPQVQDLKKFEIPMCNDVGDYIHNTVLLSKQQQWDDVV